MHGNTLIVVLLLTFICVQEIIAGFGFWSTEKKKGRDITDIPNPRTDPVGCGRETVPHSGVCDPDKLLTKDIKDEIEGYMNAMKDIEIAVVIIHRMDVQGSTKHISNTEKKAEAFARTLHDQWGVGDKETNKGILLFLSIYDRVIYFSTGEGVATTLNHRAIDSLISGMRDYLKKGDYGVAIIHTLIEMDLLLQRKIKSTYGSKLKLTLDKSTSESMFETAIAFCMFSIILACGFFCSLYQQRKIRSYERGKQELEKLMKEVDNIKDNKYAASSCPICLEDFPTPYIPTTTTTSVLSSTSETTTEIIEVEAEVRNDVKIQDENSATSEEANVKKVEDPIAQPIDQTENVNGTSSTTAETPSQSDSSGTTDHERKPMALKCGHIFCRACLEEYLSKPDGNKCPICRADIDDQPPTNGNAARPIPDSSTRQRRTLLPFRRDIRTLWNYERNGGWSAGSGSLGTQYNTGTGTYTETTFNRYAPELRYRLYRLHHYYPDAITMEAVRTMNAAIDRGAVEDIRSYVLNRGVELTRMVTEIREASRNSARSSGSRGSSSSSFSGGRSSGGRGGRW